MLPVGSRIVCVKVKLDPRLSVTVAVMVTGDETVTSEVMVVETELVLVTVVGWICVIGTVAVMVYVLPELVTVAVTVVDGQGRVTVVPG